MGFKVLLISQHLFREILVDAVLGVHVGGVKIKSFSIRCCNDASSTQRVYGGLPVLVCTRELIVCNESTVERMAESTSNASNVHRVVNDNNNPYMNMVMDAMRNNQGNDSQCPIIEEEPNADARPGFLNF
jgi:hypothetical protein